MNKIKVLAVVDRMNGGRQVMMSELSDHLAKIESPIKIDVEAVEVVLQNRFMSQHYDIVYVAGEGRVGARLRKAKFTHPRMCLGIFVDRSWDRLESEAGRYPAIPEEFEISIMRYKALSAVSRGVRDHFRKTGLEIFETRPGVAVDRFSPVATRPIIRGKPLRIGVVGDRTSRRDGFDEYIAPVLYNLWEEIENGEELFDLQCAFRKSSTYRRNAKMPRFYHGIDLLITMDSACDLPRSVLEAMACGVPVIGPAVGLLPDLIEPGGEGGWIIERSHKAIRSALIELSRDREAWRRATKKARINAAAYSWERSADSWIHFFTSAMEL